MSTPTMDQLLDYVEENLEEEMGKENGKEEHSNGKRWKCVICDAEFSTKSALQRHKLNSHKQFISVLRCPMPSCTVDCRRAYDLKKHIKALHKQSTVKAQELAASAVKMIKKNKNFLEDRRKVNMVNELESEKRGTEEEEKPREEVKQQAAEEEEKKMEEVKCEGNKEELIKRIMEAKKQVKWWTDEERRCKDVLKRIELNEMQECRDELKQERRRVQELVKEKREMEAKNRKLEGEMLRYKREEEVMREYSLSLLGMNNP